MVESISKTPVAAEVAGAIVKEAFDGAVDLVDLTECTEGWFNAVYQLGLSDASTCVLKVAPPPHVRVLTYEHDIITTEVEALRVVRDRTTVPVPEVLWWDTSLRHVPSPLFLMAECTGALLSDVRGSLDESQSAAVNAQIAGYVAQMNAITHGSFGRPDPTAPRFANWSAAFDQLISDLLADGRAADVELPATDAHIAGLARRHATALDQVATPRFVHWDLWDPNVFVDPQSYAVTGIIDFERVLWADPLMEAQFAGKRADDDNLTNSYGAAMFERPGAVARRQLYDLYLYLVMAVECAYRNYPTDDINQVARAGLAAILDEMC